MRLMHVILIILIIVIVIAVVLLLTYNSVMKLRRQTEEALATMESVRKKREAYYAEGSHTAGEMTKLDKDMENAVKYFNGCAKLYNRGISTFPGNLIADMAKLNPAELYAGDEYDS